MDSRPHVASEKQQLGLYKIPDDWAIVLLFWSYHRGCKLLQFLAIYLE